MTVIRKLWAALRGDGEMPAGLDIVKVNTRVLLPGDCYFTESHHGYDRMWLVCDAQSNGYIEVPRGHMLSVEIKTGHLRLMRIGVEDVFVITDADT